MSFFDHDRDRFGYSFLVVRDLSGHGRGLNTKDLHF
jgi:hypothetical protein